VADQEILFLPPVLKGRDPIHLEDLQALTALVDWQSCQKIIPILSRVDRILDGSSLVPQKQQKRA
jgi:hypothetical protein